MRDKSILQSVSLHIPTIYIMVWIQLQIIDGGIECHTNPIMIEILLLNVNFKNNIKSTKMIKIILIWNGKGKSIK